MSIKSLQELRNHVEIEFLKTCSYEKINEMMNQLGDRIKELEIENEKLCREVKSRAEINEPEE